MRRRPSTRLAGALFLLRTTPGRAQQPDGHRQSTKPSIKYCTGRLATAAILSCRQSDRIESLSFAVHESVPDAVDGSSTGT
jgi:hypothetical protein